MARDDLTQPGIYVEYSGVPRLQRNVLHNSMKESRPKDVVKLVQNCSQLRAVSFVQAGNSRAFDLDTWRVEIAGDSAASVAGQGSE